MAKTNFTKAEEALRETLEAMMRGHLLELATVADQGAPPAEIQNLRNRIYQACVLQLEIKRLQRTIPDLFQKLGLDKKQLEKLLADPIHLSDEQWEKVTQIKQSVNELLKTLPASNDDQLITEQRQKHINKRFNVNDKWLPLT